MWEGCGWIAQQHSFIVGLLPRVPTYLGWIAIPVVCDASRFGHALRNEAQQIRPVPQVAQ